MEVEYIALSQGIQELVAGKSLLAELGAQMNFYLYITSNVSYIWEDNIVTQNLANRKGPFMTPQTKHIGIKYHWFRSKIVPTGPNKIVVLRIDTKE